MNQLQTDEKFMRLALNEAQKALKEQEVPIGAVVVAGDAVIGRGHNLVETLADPTAHAEMQALTAAAVRACISAWAVGSASVSTRLCPRPMTASPATTTAPMGTSCSFNAFCASFSARRMNFSSVCS